MHQRLRALLVGLRHQLPTLLTLAALAGLAWWVHAYDGKIPKLSALLGHGAAEPDKSRDREVGAGSPRPAEPAGGGSEAPLPPVKLASTQAAAKAGLHWDFVQVRSLAQQVSANAALEYDPTRYAHLSTRVPGMAWRVDARVGDTVKKGDVLALVAAAAVGKAKADFLQALVQWEVKQNNLQRMQASAGSISEQAIRTATADLRQARIRVFNDHQALLNLGLAFSLEEWTGLPDEEAARRLRLLGLPPDLASGPAAATLTANLLPLRAPFDGLVVRRDVVKGEMVAPDKPQLVIADPSRLWVLLDARQEDAAELTPGQEVVFVSDSGGPPAAGRLAWVSPEVDRKTRTVQARAEIDNANGKLRPATFGTARVVVRHLSHALVVPDEAVQWDGKGHLVFVRIADDLFQPRRIKRGVRGEGYTQILEGIQAGEQVVTSGSHILKSELFKDRIGGGDEE